MRNFAKCLAVGAIAFTAFCIGACANGEQKSPSYNDTIVTSSHWEECENKPFSGMFFSSEYVDCCGYDSLGNYITYTDPDAEYYDCKIYVTVETQREIAKAIVEKREIMGELHCATPSANVFKFIANEND